LQNISNLAQVLTGTYAQKQLDKKQLNLQNEMSQAEANAMAKYLQLKEGTPGQAATPEFVPQGMTLRDDQGNLNLGVTEAKPAVPGMPGNIEAANLYGSQQRYAPFLRQMAQKKLMEDPIWEKTEINANGQVVKGVYDKRNPDVMATFRPYNAAADIPLATAEYSGIVPKSTQTTAPNAIATSSFVAQAQQQGLPIISGVRTPLEQAELRHHRDPQTGQWLTKEGRPVAENSAHLHGNAIDLKPNAPLTQSQQAWLTTNAYQPNPAKDANHWELKPNANAAAANSALPAKTKYDLEPPTSFNTPKERDEWFAKAREPLTGEAAKKADGAVTTLNALDNYKKLIDGYSKSQVLMPNDRAKLSEAHTQLMLQLKDANGLGVLNKGDLPLLEKLIVNPTSIENLLLSKNVLESQIGNQKAFMRDVAANSYLNNYKEIPPRIKQALINVDSDVEKANAQKDVAKAANLQKPVVYNSQSAAQAAGKSGKLQDGQKVVIGGNVYTWKND